MRTTDGTMEGTMDGGRAAARSIPTGAALLETVLRSLNDPEAQAQAYAVLDEFEDAIDLEGTDILHGWRHDLVPDTPDTPDTPDSPAAGDPERGSCFSDAFSNAFRVMVLRRDEEPGQPVLRRVGWSGESWVWEHTGTVIRWVVEMSGRRGGKYTRLSTVEKALGENLRFDSGAAACEAVRNMLAIGGYGDGLGFRVRAVETGPVTVNGPTSEGSG